MPTISIIIPAYKHCGYVLQTLESVFAQTFTDYEVIVVNDGSPDNTAHVLKPLVDAGRIRYFEQKNQGQAAARNRGLAEAKGEFIALLDDDDLWPPDKLQWQLEVLQQCPQAPAIGGTCEIINAAGEHIRNDCRDSSSLSFESLFQGNPFYSPGQVLIRAEAIRIAGGFDPRIWGTDDMDLWFRLARSAAILRQDRVALRYRLHANNASRNVLKMYNNTQKVTNRHLRTVPLASRRRCRREADYFLYICHRRQFISQLKAALRSRRPLKVGRALFEVVYFTARLMSSPGLVARMLRDLMPNSWRLRPKGSHGIRGS